MRNYGRRRPRFKAAESNSHWLSFSDLMSALVLVFILVMFYSVYQYNQMLLIAEADLFEQSQRVAEKENELDLKNEELDLARTTLDDQERALLQERIQLNMANEKIEEINAKILAQQNELSEKQKLLDDQAALLSDQQTQLSTQMGMLAEQQREIDYLVGIRVRIIEMLRKALTDANIRASVDSKTGSIVIENNVLYDYNSSTLSQSGKEMLDKLIPVYLSVLLSDENKANVSEIVIEGHTDMDGTYMYNQELSQKRANAVVSYIMAGENNMGLSESIKQNMMERLSVVGRAYSDPWYDSAGNYDANASRRVVFKFRLYDEQMISNLQSIMSAGD